MFLCRRRSPLVTAPRAANRSSITVSIGKGRPNTVLTGSLPAVQGVSRAALPLMKFRRSRSANCLPWLRPARYKGAKAERAPGSSVREHFVTDRSGRKRDGVLNTVTLLSPDAVKLAASLRGLAQHPCEPRRFPRVEARLFWPRQPIGIPPSTITKATKESREKTSLAVGGCEWPSDAPSIGKELQHYCCLFLVAAEAGRTSLHGSADDFLSGILWIAAS
jgi:hypothetical protein